MASTSPINALEASIDPEIARVIASIKAIDNYAHPLLPVLGAAPDRDFDALPVEGMKPASDPVARRPDNPQLPLAWKSLWNLNLAAPLDQAGTKRLEAAREKIKAQIGPAYDEWVLDRAGIGIMLANRVTLGAGISPPRFRWVPYADALLLPLDTSVLSEETPDKKLFFQLEDNLRARYLKSAGFVRFHLHWMTILQRSSIPLCGGSTLKVLWLSSSKLHICVTLPSVIHPVRTRSGSMQNMRTMAGQV